MVLQERLYFRNIPLSEWVEHEMIVEDGNDLKRLAKSCSVFAAKALNGGDSARNVRMIREHESAQPA